MKNKRAMTIIAGVAAGGIFLSLSGSKLEMGLCEVEVEGGGTQWSVVYAKNLDNDCIPVGDMPEEINGSPYKKQLKKDMKVAKQALKDAEQAEDQAAIDAAQSALDILEAQKVVLDSDHIEAAKVGAEELARAAGVDWISATSWGCAPYCMRWQAGCPPIKCLCKYGAEWPASVVDGPEGPECPAPPPEPEPEEEEPAIEP